MEGNIFTVPLEIILKKLITSKQKELIELENGQININWIENVYQIGLYFSRPSKETGNWQNYTNIYLVYIYSIIQVSVTVLYKTLDNLNNNKFVQDLKTMKILSEQEIVEIRNDILACLTRLEIYETIIRKLFYIPLKENNLEIIGSKFPAYKDIPEQILKQLETSVVSPLFFGQFYNVYTPPIVFVTCKKNINGEKQDCKIMAGNKFPFPILEKDWKTSYPDSVKPFALWNQVATKATTSAKIIDNLGYYNRFVAELWGFGDNYPEYIRFHAGADAVIKNVKEKVEQAGEAGEKALEAGAALAGNLYEIGKDATRFIGNIGTYKSDLSNQIMLMGAIGLAAYFIVNEGLK